MSEDYNGWIGKGNRASAYATWRVNMELLTDTDWPAEFSDRGQDKPGPSDLGDELKDWATEIVCGEDYNAEHLATQYALAFLDDVSWDEIAEHILADWPED
jgi:hypothetical protein